MLDQETKIKVDSMTMEEIGEKLALNCYGSMDSDKSRYAQYVLEIKKRKLNDERNLALIGSIAALIDGLEKQVNKIMISNEKIAKAQNVVAAALVLVTLILAWVTWIKQ